MSRAGPMQPGKAGFDAAIEIFATPRFASKNLRAFRSYGASWKRNAPLSYVTEGGCIEPRQRWLHSTPPVTQGAGRRGLPQGGLERCALRRLRRTERAQGASPATWTGSSATGSAAPPTLFAKASTAFSPPSSARPAASAPPTISSPCSTSPPVSSTSRLPTENSEEPRIGPYPIA